MTEKVKNKVLEKWKKKALEWHKSQGGNVKIPKEAREFVPEERSCEIELEFVRELKKVIIDSDLDRKSILLNVLANQEKSLEKGITPGKLPEVVKNIARKPRIKEKIVELSKKYGVGGSNLYYLWGLDNVR